MSDAHLELMAIHTTIKEKMDQGWGLWSAMKRVLLPILSEKDEVRDDLLKALKPFAALHDNDPDWVEQDHGDRSIATALGPIEFKSVRDARDAIAKAEGK